MTSSRPDPAVPADAETERMLAPGEGPVTAEHGEVLAEVPADAVGEGAGGGVETIPARGGSLPPLREVARLKQPSTLGGVVYLVVLGMALVGVAIAAGGAWRMGVSWLGASLVAVSVARLLLPEANAGMLAVRGRNLDALMLSSAGVVLLVLAATIPGQP